jgi:NTP pyrophosphatase (non-canonical NTP hydrolase)
MRPNDYQSAARGTAIYPASVTVFYPALGLAGEAGELANKLKKTLRGDSKLADKLDDLRAELGDVCWYIAGLASDCGIILETVCVRAAAQKKPEGDLYSLSLKLLGQCGMVASLADGYRSNGANDLQRQFIEARLQDIVAIVTVMAEMMGTTFEKVCADNAAKLANRKQNGTLQGDGDKR